MVLIEARRALNAAYRDYERVSAEVQEAYKLTGFTAGFHEHYGDAITDAHERVAKARDRVGDAMVEELRGELAEL